MPGERALARRFHVNAKTLSKALTDLAAEGVLNRSIGRGTYVRGSVPAVAEKGRWLVISDSGQSDSSLIQTLRSVNPELQVNVGTADLRPSFLNQFDAVIDIATHTPDSFLRDLVVRNMPVVAVNREPKMYSMHSVLVDDVLRRGAIGPRPGAGGSSPVCGGRAARMHVDQRGVAICRQPNFPRRSGGCLLGG